MGVREVVSTLIELVRLMRTRRYLAPRPLDAIDSIGLRVEELATQFDSRTMAICEDREITWGAFNALANRYAHALARRGSGHGDVVS